ncbi:RNA-binding S4 domain-containing protein [Jiella marina]|uniref:RNA-binding S4 domain-containing protein n=1 Tax=Jiella sp. LLJ827 TaxID=2917712 RepID=UPI002101458C|nr:RNA-binding S4 domain-containing protein [Jiella sp. LLJ827]MCQ0987986.1 RNA-binding S4 domain-containing protein [Jiella sp. LLJ827]
MVAEADKPVGEVGAGGASQRVDKWLFFARIVKSRTLAQKLVQSGGVRVNRDKIDNPARQVRVGDTLTISYARAVRVLTIRQPGLRRGPAPEAATLYEEIVPATPDKDDNPSSRGPAAAPEAGAGRPSKKDRRALQRLKQGEAG